MFTHIDIATLSQLSRGVEDNNNNGVFDEGDTLKAYRWNCGSSVKDVCGCWAYEQDYVLTSTDTASFENLSEFLQKALNRRVRFFESNRDKDIKRTYMALSRVGCGDKEDELAYVYCIRFILDIPRVWNGEPDRLVFTGQHPWQNMDAWIASADEYLSK